MRATQCSGFRATAYFYLIISVHLTLLQSMRLHAVQFTSIIRFKFGQDKPQGRTHGWHHTTALNKI
ncbi:uncharacterized protein BP01DRAFT_128304 [Aspergillus saccharolyticus JOP 1030-1]|uniref:Uncharacterized protein n=1 Tax=Aspergillus saccharolyticus JOP 1030-1 TaxID=1450539 RepID=A0A318Z8L5_9EURO|nr:hypothetical protein BP01DRAFT_128304 [Aspergillus saccharolyticus JOP 1030-1]PYH42734.1 hypothetical protein BP01DRAFT_128304 [Aspergillus saccharolyticus JOP 1030-1]